MNTVAARHPVTGALCNCYKLEEICTKDRDWLVAQGVHARPRHYDDLVDWLNGAGVAVLGVRLPGGRRPALCALAKEYDELRSKATRAPRAIFVRRPYTGDIVSAYTVRSLARTYGHSLGISDNHTGGSRTATAVKILLDAGVVPFPAYAVGTNSRPCYFVAADQFDRYAAEHGWKADAEIEAQEQAAAAPEPSNPEPAPPEQRAGDGTFGITPEFIERMVRLHATVSAANARLGLEEICDRIAEQVAAKLLETLPAALFSQCQNRMRAIAMEVIDQATSPAQGGEA